METEQELYQLLQKDRYLVIRETDILQLVHQHEKGFLMDKVNQLAYALGWYYGDPSCGAIDINNKWAILGGLDLSVLWKDREIIPLPFDDMHDIRQINENHVQILTDPWTTTSAIYTLPSTHSIYQVEGLSRLYKAQSKEWFY
ncbi:hypothetical protein [Chitinophaga sp. CF418]|uniref:hypothetical protein n=1 Tax=Chitinophaga sp. CF418 TaxID=1855287 RepID=UPI0009212ACE|nr:hypothetical protein [Chitinophaga sp. CF418]SHN46078.1 hypothetical protein SAMN05216311_122108 [Chitinophaga sp. CF418]